MLDEIFNSKTRVKVLAFFFQDEGVPHYTQEIIRATKIDAANVFRELMKLNRLHILDSSRKGNRRYYTLNPRSPHYRGLRALFIHGAAPQSLVPEHQGSLLPVSGSISETLKERLMHREWYHQRFDGSPMFLFDVGEAELKREKRKPEGTEANIRVCFFKDGKADWYLDMADVRRGSQTMIRLARRNPNIGTELMASWKHDEERFQRLFETIDECRLRSMSDDELLKFHQRYHRAFIDRFTSSAIIDHFALGTDTYIEKMLREEIGSVDKESDFTAIFSVTTAPVHQSFINEAEIQLLNIAIQAPHDTQRIAEYQRKYFWTKNNYITAKTLTIRDFQREIMRWERTKADVHANYRQLLDTPIINRRKKVALFKKYRFSPLLRTLLKISEEFSWWQDERKKATYLNIYIGMKVLGEIARRRGYRTEEMKYLLAPEVPSVLLHGRPTRSELHQRMRYSAVVMQRNECSFITGKAVDRLQHGMFPKKTKDLIRDIRGLSASMGRAIGPVRIIQSVTEINKVQKGDVLVAVMTRPDYVPAMRKAAAIVTNEGGVTSHAAIVSRELGIPCIIGTKIATRVFKDGDVVEVNANHGWVRKLR